MKRGTLLALAVSSALVMAWMVQLTRERNRATSIAQQANIELSRCTMTLASVLAAYDRDVRPIR